MDIFLSINNREQVIQLPIVPTKFKIPSAEKHDTFETISHGEIKLLGPKALKEITIESYFPNKKYSFAKSDDYRGWEYVELIETWRDRKVPMRLIITNTPINMAVAIDDFEHGIEDRTGDVYYSLAMSEFPLIRLRSRKV